MWLAICIVAFLLLLWWLDASQKRQRKRRLARLAALLCPGCNMPFGEEAACRTEQEHLAACEAARKAHPGARFRFDDWWKVRCPYCHRVSKFNFMSETLEPAETDA
jgi:hypothetical protein